MDVSIAVRSMPCTLSEARELPARRASVAVARTKERKYMGTSLKPARETRSFALPVLAHHGPGTRDHAFANMEPQKKKGRRACKRGDPSIVSSRPANRLSSGQALRTSDVGTIQFAHL